MLNVIAILALIIVLPGIWIPV